MGPELELKRNSDSAMEVSAVKETGVICIDPEEMFTPCVSNYKENIFNMDELCAKQTTALNRIENQEINITECSGPNEDVQIVENECQDLTESSSSFGDTVSGTENGSMLDGDEVESQYCENPSVSLYDGYSDAFHTRYIGLNYLRIEYLLLLFFFFSGLFLGQPSLMLKDGSGGSGIVGYILG